jgi:hypothetical protein
MDHGNKCGHTFIVIDIDICTDLYTALKSKKQIRGVPTLLAYKKDNVSLIADKSISGTNTKEIDAFFVLLNYENVNKYKN